MFLTYIICCLLLLLLLLLRLVGVLLRDGAAGGAGGGEVVVVVVLLSLPSQLRGSSPMLDTPKLLNSKLAMCLAVVASSPLMRGV